MTSKPNNIYYLLIAGKRVGPLTFDDLKLRGLDSEMLVWKEGESGWFSAEQYEELKPIVIRTILRRKKFKILRTYRIPIVVVSLITLVGAVGYSAIGWFQSGNSEFPSITRAPDDEEEERARLLGRQKDSSSLPQRNDPQDVEWLKFYNQFAAALSIDRFLAGDAQVMTTCEQLAETAPSPEFQQLAVQAAALWKERSDIGAPRLARLAGASEYEVLWNQLHPENPDDSWLLMERRFRELWKRLVESVKENLQSDELRTVSELVTLDRSLDQKTAESWGPNLAFLNTSGSTLKNCTIEVTLETPWSLRVTHWYFREEWDPDFKWILKTGMTWGVSGLQQTDSVTFSVWSDQGFLVDQRVLLEEKRRAILEQAFAFFKAELDRGKFSILGEFADGITRNGELSPEARNTATELKTRAEKIRSSFEQVRRLLDPNTDLIGFWRFGIRQGPIGLKILEPELDPRLNRGLPASEYDAQTQYRGEFYDPTQPSLARSLAARILFVPETDDFALWTSAASGTAVTSAETKLNYLLVENDPELKLIPEGDTFRCRTPTGLELNLISKYHPEATARLAQWKSSGDTWRPANIPEAQSGLPANLLPAPPEISLSTVDWKLGEIRRFSAKDSGRTVNPVEQVLFSARGTSLYSVGRDSWMEVRDTRSGRLDFGLPIGSGVAVTRSERYLASAGRGGTLLFKHARGDYEQEFFKIPAQTVLFNPSGSRLITLDRENWVRVLKLNGEAEAQAKLEQPIQATAISPDGRLLAIATADRQLHLLDVQRDLNQLASFKGSLKEVVLIEVAPDSSSMLVVGSAEPESIAPPAALRMSASPSGDRYELQLWNLKSPSLVHSISIGRPATCIAVSNDWKAALTGHSSGPISVWDMTRGAERHWLVGHTGRTNSLSISPDRRFALSGGEDGNTILWGLPE